MPAFFTCTHSLQKKKQFAIQEESPNTLKRELSKENDTSIVGSNLNDVLSQEIVNNNKPVQEEVKVPYPG
jgi:hypothetical protein